MNALIQKFYDTQFLLQLTQIDDGRFSYKSSAVFLATDKYANVLCYRMYMY